MEQLAEYLPGLAESGATVKVASSSPSEDLHIYDLFFDLEKAAYVSDTVYTFSLGAPGKVTGSLRLTRENCYWLFARQSHALPANTDTQVLALRNSGHVLVLLPLTTESYQGTLRGPMHEEERGSIFLRLEQFLHPTNPGRVVVAIGPNLNLALKNAVERVRTILGKPNINASSGVSTLSNNYLTYCTWNSLQPPTPTCANSALETLEHLRSLGIRPARLLLDDSWQDTNSFRTLQSFNPVASFIEGYKSLAEVVKIAKEKYGVRDVGVWHTIQGYWAGIDTDKFASQYRLVKVTKDGYPGPTEPAGFQSYIPHPESVGPFFRDYYSALRAAGITFVKCDNVASIDHIISAVEAT
ncbi:hypothetical protein FRC07_013348, partial [Ceratobasidium sp. 392]